jgi:hypothetical protein
VQEPNGWSFVGSVASAIKKQVELKNKLNMRVLGEKQLLKCQGCGCVLRLKVFVPIETLSQHLDENDLKEFDPRCWVTAEMKP